MKEWFSTPCRGMPALAGTAALLCLFLALLTGLAAAQGGVEALRATYERFREAMRDDDGEMAVELISARSFQYFERIKRLALEAEESEIRSLPPFEQFHVVIFRHGLSPAELEHADPRLVVTWFINEGWFGTGVYVFSELEQVDVTGDWATAKISFGGQQAPFDYQFWKEDGEWKIDLTTTHKVANRSLLDLADRNKIAPGDVITRLVEIVSGRPVDARVWRPMRSWSDGSESGSQ